MPTHVYQPHRNPPTWWDRLLVHSMEWTVAAIAFFVGILLTLSLVFPAYTPSSSMDKMPLVIAVLSAVFMIGGSALALLGLNWQGNEVGHGWAIERFGWMLAFGGFGTYAISVSWHFPESVISWGIAALLGAGSALRAWAVWKIEQDTRRNKDERQSADVKGEER